jgi:hypothetical protein
VPIDAWLPTGELVLGGARRPASTAMPGCSTRQPVCVHAAPGVESETARAALVALERAFERLVWVLELPSPLPDRNAGGSDALDWYLSAEPGWLTTGHDSPEYGFWDSAPAFCVGGAFEASERAASRCVAEAIAWRLDAAETSALRAGYAEQLWWRSGMPDHLDQAQIDGAQAHPERAASSRSTAPLWFDYLDSRVSTLPPGGLGTALMAVSATRTAPAARRWDNEPDLFDVLRHTLDKKPARFAGLLADFAASRAFVGTRDVTATWPGLGWSGSFGRVRYDWVIPYSSLPRRVAATRPIQPTGSIYVWLHFDQNPGQAPLGFQAQWEPPVSFVWTLVKVARNGAESSRVSLPYQQRATSAEQQLNELGELAAVLAIGTNVGDVELAHPFDPDVLPFEPQACTVYLTKL